MNLNGKDRKDIGALGEKVAREYLRRHGFLIVEQNVKRKLGEVDIIARKRRTLHFVEVKSMAVEEFPDSARMVDEYDPTVNLHPQKIRKVARLAQWYVAEKEHDDEWQVDGVLVWLRKKDGQAKVSYLPQLV